MDVTLSNNLAGLRTEDLIQPYSNPEDLDLVLSQLNDAELSPLKRLTPPTKVNLFRRCPLWCTQVSPTLQVSHSRLSDSVVACLVHAGCVAPERY